MAALTTTKTASTGFNTGGKYAVYTVVPTTATDTISVSSDFTTVYHAEAQVTAGNDANLMTIYCTISGTTVTLNSVGADGAAASDWTGATARVQVFGI